MTVTQLEERALGAMLGLAAGDALGAAVEFRRPGTFPPVTDMRGGGPFGLEAGYWTDDTSMALCLAESLVERGGFDARDQVQRYVRWWREGYLSSTGRCFDIGGTVLHALTEFERTGEPFSGPTAESTAGNGSLMRLAPVPIRWSREPEVAIEMAAESSRTTHGAPQAIDACRYYAGLIAGALGGAGKDELLSPAWSPMPGLWERAPLHPSVATVAAGSFRRKTARDLPASGYVVHTLEAALWAFHSTDDFESGALAAVNLGNDADTTGAVYGQLAGAYYGVRGIPDKWLVRLPMREGIEELARALADASAP